MNNNKEHAVIIEDIQEATSKGLILQKVMEIMRNGEWEKYRKNPDLEMYYHVKEELYEDQGMILRDGRIVLPEKLQRKATKTAHEMGHMGSTKTKEMMRRKYWFPKMAKLIIT